MFKIAKLNGYGSPEGGKEFADKTFMQFTLCPFSSMSVGYNLRISEEGTWRTARSDVKLTSVGEMLRLLEQG